MGAKGYRTDEEDKDDDCKTERGNLFQKVSSDVSSDWSDGMHDVSEHIKSRRDQNQQSTHNKIKESSPKRFVGNRRDQNTNKSNK